MRRRVAETIHDGPVQELIGLDMILASARKAASEGRGDDATRLLDDARELTERNIRTLRDELVDLGPYAFEELGFATAIENCLPIWKRRYGSRCWPRIDDLDLPPEVAGDLFRHRAGGRGQRRPARRGRRRLALAAHAWTRGSSCASPTTATASARWTRSGRREPGHLGLAMMRERAELLGGTLEIETSERGHARAGARSPGAARSVDTARRMSQANVELVQEIYERWANQASASGSIAEDFEYVNPPYAVEPGTRRDRRALASVSDIFADFYFEPERYVDAGDDVVVIGVASGTTASGVEAQWRQGYIWTIQGGKAIRFRWFNDPAEALEAAGLTRRAGLAAAPAL